MQVLLFFSGRSFVVWALGDLDRLFPSRAHFLFVGLVFLRRFGREKEEGERREERRGGVV